MTGSRAKARKLQPGTIESLYPLEPSVSVSNIQFPLITPDRVSVASLAPQLISNNVSSIITCAPPL